MRHFINVLASLARATKPVWAGLCLLLPLFAVTGYGQTKEQGTRGNYPMQIDLPLLDMPFQRDATLAGELFDSYSMQQALAVTQNLHRVNYHFNNKLWHGIIRPDSKRKHVYNRIAANVTSGLVDYVFTYYGVVFSAQWLHEEFHRAGLTIRGLSSYDETYNRLNGGLANGSVSRVKDEDLIRMKKDAPQELVRSFAAGIESEFLLLRGLQKDNFFGGAKHANIALNILLTKHAIDYVNQFKRIGYNASIDSMNAHGLAVADRDFVGWDFTPWVYDLHRPDEPYEARGRHPSGVGIDRAIKTTALTGEELRYLKRMGNLQYLNFVSPFLIGINRIRLNDQTAFNVAVRHYLNSFGYDLTADFFIDHRDKQYLFSLHGYRNKHRLLPGIEMERSPHAFDLMGDDRLLLQPMAMLWLQPGEFYDRRARPGGLLRLQGAYSLGNTWRVVATAEAKTAGWVAGNPYLDAKASLRLGIAAFFHANNRRTTVLM
ncbi:hypothetical protein JHJ32_14430 [Parapedobacter sp. ISTM3]|uniref:hypothetical protein n=1 Tax=Parapedobacter sp. ISTM3 TaxID=2800130 RepID=UPI0019083CC3|nr:hypothetical protein [Parapedobacter sp. ISTM3]MBK1441192.1 hypothetical protein [Parapedobacter sp. ISTM3]